MTGRDLSPRLSRLEADELVRDAVEAQAQLAVTAEIAARGVARADALAASSGVVKPPARPRRVEQRRAAGFRSSLRFAIRQRMYRPEYLELYARFLAQRLRHPHVELQGMVFLGPRVELHARRHHARLSLGAWCWIGADNRLRAHEGHLRLGPKVVMGRDNVVNAYLDVEIGRNALLGDWIYVCDFDHIYERADVPIKKQGLVKSPVRIGEDVWVGEKASILRGADIGAGSVVGSQSLVKSPIPPFSIAVGTPARVVGTRLPKGMTVEEALTLQRGGAPIPGDPLGV